MLKANEAADHVQAELVLNKKSLAILRLIGESGVASLEQLHTYFGQNVTLKTTRRHLRRLEKLGCLVSSFTDVRGKPELIFSLSRSGLNQFSKKEQERLLLGIPKYNELRQQLLVQEARLVLEDALTKRGARLVEWRNEHLLRSLECKRQMQTRGVSYYEVELQGIPDALAVTQEANGQTSEISIEADGAYYGRTLEHKLSTIANSSQNWLWVTYPGRRAARLARLLEAYPNLELFVVES